MILVRWGNLPQNFSGIDVRSNIASIWSELSNAYKYNGKFDSAKVALRKIGCDQRRGLIVLLLNIVKIFLFHAIKRRIRFTDGDNDTYPLLVHLQDIEKVRTDVATVINLGLLNASHGT